MSTTDFAEILRLHDIKPSAVAASLGLNKATISRWKKVPPERVEAVEAATGIPRHVLRPDLSNIFAAPEQGRAA
jgi:DNA-binding transcriptional regulator YdaS (Cro superfamily)